ncbi:MAG: methyltransferase [Caulobacteraceae bacterium]
MSQPDPAQAILGLSTAYWASRCLHLAAELGVADVLGEEPQTAEGLAAALGVKADPLMRVLRCLTNHGVFEMTDGKFAHSASSRLLRSDGRPSLRALPRMMGLKMHWGAYGELEHTLRTGEPGVDRAAGECLFDYFERNPEHGRVFDDAMTAKSFAQIGPVLAAYDFSPFKTIADVGGGAGHLLSAVLGATPGAQGVLFDLPAVVKRAAERPDPRIRYVGGSFFEDEVPACDAYMMMTVLHDWSDAECAKILAAIKRTAPAGAKMLLLECVVGLATGFDFSKELDIEMLVMTTGRERTGEEWGQVLADGGWRLTRIVPTRGVSAIIEAELA